MVRVRSVTVLPVTGGRKAAVSVMMQLPVLTEERIEDVVVGWKEQRS